VATLDSVRITQAEYDTMTPFGQARFRRIFRKGEIMGMDQEAEFRARLAETYSGRLLTLREALRAVGQAVVVELRRIAGL
jgi:hypothetical protein